MALGWKDVKAFAVQSFTEHLLLKTIALVVALGLFGLVRFQEKVDRWIDVEVAVMRPNERSDLVVTSDMPDKVRVSLRGRTSVIKAVKAGDAGQVVMDLSARAEAGTFTFYFEPEMFDFPSGVEILHISPESVQVRIEKIVSRRIAVNVRTTGKPKPGLELEGAPVAVPPEVTISGPSSVVNTVVALDTEEINVENLGVGEHEVNVPLKRLGGVSVKYVDKLAVVVAVRYTPGQRVLGELAVRAFTEGAPAGEAAGETRPGAVTATLSGPQVVLDALDPKAVVPVAKVGAEAAARGGTVVAPVELDGLPAGVEIRSIVPPTVKVRIRPAAPGAAGGKKNPASGE
jgi:YbbR domain-containing protein